MNNQPPTQRKMKMLTRRQTRDFLQKLDPSYAEASDGKRTDMRISYLAEGCAESHLSESRNLTSRDISEGGMGILTHQNLEVGQKLLISIEHANCSYEFDAIVKHCTLTIGMNKVGVAFVFAD